jgi:hypothetical protein
MKKNLKLVSSPGYPRFCFLLVLPLLLSAFTYAQTGTVTDASNQPVSGATVTVKGTAKALKHSPILEEQVSPLWRQILIQERRSQVLLSGG